jgi:hypothetical protein
MAAAGAETHAAVSRAAAKIGTKAAVITASTTKGGNKATAASARRLGRRRNGQGDGKRRHDRQK